MKRISCTREICKAQQPQTIGTLFGVIKEDREGKASFIQVVPSDNSQLPQGDVFKMIHSNKDISSYFTDCLQNIIKKNKLQQNQNIATL